MKRLFLFFFSIPCFSCAQNLPTDSLDVFIAKQVADYKIPGLAIGIIKDNQVVFKKGYGVTSTRDGLPVTTQTIFPIMSCTKAFTAAAMGILVDEGKLDWNDKVIKYLPDFKLSDPWITKHLTIADILSHRSGLESSEGDLLWYGTDYSRQEIVKRIRYSPVKNSFRSSYGYNNVMYLVAGLVIEKISYKSWDEFIKKEIFLPLLMNNSSSSTGEMIKDKNYALPHQAGNPIPLMNLDNIAPAGAINSTIDDMLKWMQVWTNTGNSAGKQLISSEALKTITTTKVMLSDKSDESYGFGWNIGFADGKKIISHGGGLPGYKSSVTIIPSDKTAIVILSNKITYLTDELAEIIIKYLTGKEMNWKESDKNMQGKNFNFSWDDNNTDTSSNQHIRNLSAYKGIYEDKAYGKASIREVNGRAILEFLPAKKHFTGSLYYLGADKFKIIFNDKFISPGEVLFEMDKNKKIVGFKLNIESSDFNFKYLNFKRK
jgi:CubicO group peptidase (beta-lactamase class C family)